VHDTIGAYDIPGDNLSIVYEQLVIYVIFGEMDVVSE
jgi:hypothetical protein